MKFLRRFIKATNEAQITLEGLDEMRGGEAAILNGILMVDLSSTGLVFNRHSAFLMREAIADRIEALANGAMPRHDEPKAVEPVA